jgi:hypothetical protein
MAGITDEGRQDQPDWADGPDCIYAGTSLLEKPLMKDVKGA